MRVDFSSNDLRTFEGFNKELVGDLRTDKDGLINQQIKLFKFLLNIHQQTCMVNLLVVKFINLVFYLLV